MVTDGGRGKVAAAGGRRRVVTDGGRGSGKLQQQEVGGGWLRMAALAKLQQQEVGGGWLRMADAALASCGSRR